MEIEVGSFWWNAEQQRMLRITEVRYRCVLGEYYGGELDGTEFFHNSTRLFRKRWICVKKPEPENDPRP